MDIRNAGKITNLCFSREELPEDIQIHETPILKDTFITYKNIRRMIMKTIFPETIENLPLFVH